MVQTPLTPWNTSAPWPELKKTYLLSFSIVSLVIKDFILVFSPCIGDFSKSYFLSYKDNLFQGMTFVELISLNWFTLLPVLLGLLGFTWFTRFRLVGLPVKEAPFKLTQALFGHCTNSFCIPPSPHSNGHSGALFSC